MPTEGARGTSGPWQAPFGLGLPSLPAARRWTQGLGKSPGCLGASGWDARHSRRWPPLMPRSAAVFCQSSGNKRHVLGYVTLRVTYRYVPSAQKHFPRRDLHSPTFCPFRGLIGFMFVFPFIFPPKRLFAGRRILSVNVTGPGTEPQIIRYNGHSH